MSKQESYKIKSATVYASEPDRDAAIGLQGEEDFRMFVTMPKSAADTLTDQLVAAGFGKAAGRG